MDKGRLEVIDRTEKNRLLSHELANQFLEINC